MPLKRNTIFILLLCIILCTFQFCNIFLSQNKKLHKKEINYLNYIKKETKKFYKEKKYIVFIKNDVICAAINIKNGNLEHLYLLKYKQNIDSQQPFELIKKDENFSYRATSKIIGMRTPDYSINSKNKTYYKTNKKNFFFNKKNATEIRIPLIWNYKNNFFCVKTFILKRNEYKIKVEYDIYNFLKKTKCSILHQLRQNTNLLNKNPKTFSFLSKNTYQSSAISSNKNKYEKKSFDDIMKNKNIFYQTKNGWIAFLQQYFSIAWIPSSPINHTFYTKKIGNYEASVNCLSSLIPIKKMHSHKISSSLWAGPKLQQEMKIAAPYLDRTIDYGYLWFIAKPLFKLLNFFYTIVKNWGFAIILTTFSIRSLIYPLTKSQYISSKKLYKIQPKINKIQKKFKNNKTILNEKITKIYKKENFNPIINFLTTFLQMPFFLSLYYVLTSSIELRHANFIFWIKDLSSKDPFFILPILMGITMFFSQRITIQTKEKSAIQNYLTNLLPFISTLFFLYFPSGLVLYYVVSNIITILQHQFIFNKSKKF